MKSATKIYFKYYMLIFYFYLLLYFINIINSMKLFGIYKKFYKFLVVKLK